MARAVVAAIAFLLSAGFPLIAHACEPVVPLMMLYAGAAGWAAVATKSALGLLVIVAIKCGVFLWKSEFKSMAALIFANLVSTGVGVVAVVMAAVPMVFMIAIPVLYFAFLVPAKSIQKVGLFRRRGMWEISALLTIVMVASVVLWVLAGRSVDTSHATYWILKVAYCTVGTGLSFIVTIACEEVVISAYYKTLTWKDRTFFEPVFWCNAAAFIVALSAGAAVAIPKRLASPDFLISLLRLVNLA